MKRFQRQVKNIDIFSRPFSFSVGDSKEKQTLFGGFLSLAIIGVSLTYLTYLLYLYFNNGMLPKIVKQNYNQMKGSIPLSSNFVAFQIMAEGTAWQDYEAQKGQSYFQINFMLQEVAGTYFSVTSLPTMNCDEPSFVGFQCLDLDAMTSSQKEFFINTLTLSSQSLILYIMKCSGLATCASATDISDLVKNPKTYLAMYTGIRSYNTETNALETSYNLEYFSFDNTLFTESSYSMIRSKTEVISGLVVQSTEELNHFISYKRYDRSHSQTDAATLFQPNSYMYFEFKLDTSYEVNTIQYPMITEVLTQFTSVLNVLLIFGFFAYFIADSDIIQDLSGLLLKEYYKLTILDLIHTQQQPLEKECELDADEIIRTQKEIDEQDFREHAGRIFKMSLLQRAKIFILPQSKKRKTVDTKEAAIFKKIIEQTQKKVDIYEVYRDIIKLKMMIKLILSEDQFAAIQHCGCRLDGHKVSIQEDNQLKLTENDPNNSINLSVKNQSRKVFPLGKQSTVMKKSLNKEITSIDPETSKAIMVKPFGVVDQSGDTSILSQKQFLEECSSPNIVKRKDVQECHKEEIESADEEKSEQKNLEDEIPNEQYQNATTNHLNAIDLIESQPQEMRKQLNKFLQRMKAKSIPSSGIDKRIYSSLIACHSQDQLAKESH